MSSSIENKIIIILILFACILSFNIGYANYSNASLGSDVTSNVKQFNIEYSNPLVIKSDGTNKVDSMIGLSGDRKSIQLNNINFSYPGAFVEFKVDITNNGLYSAKLTSIKTEGFKDTSAIKIKGLDNSNTINKTLMPGEKSTISFTIYWDKNYTIVSEETTNFSIKLDFTQQI